MYKSTFSALTCPLSHTLIYFPTEISGWMCQRCLKLKWVKLNYFFPQICSFSFPHISPSSINFTAWIAFVILFSFFSTATSLDQICNYLPWTMQTDSCKCLLTSFLLKVTLTSSHMIFLVNVILPKILLCFPHYF